MSLSPREEFLEFLKCMGPERHSGLAVAFFIGYASGAAGVRLSIEDIIAEFKLAGAKIIEFPATDFEGGPK